MGERKRRTRTSTEVKGRYNKKAYEAIKVLVPKEMGVRFKEKVKENGDSMASVVRKAIGEYLAESTKDGDTVKGGGTGGQ